MNLLSFIQQLIQTRNAPFATAGPFDTKLSPAEEVQFQAWAQKTGAPITPDYDMRGYWKDIASKGRSETAINKIDQRLHFPDTYKTPLHPSFSNESKYATKNNPFAWTGEVLIDKRTGKPVLP